MTIDYSRYNYHLQPPGMTKDQADKYLPQLFMAISEEERLGIISRQPNPWPETNQMHRDWMPIDPINWRFPGFALPKSYLDFLIYSNGATAFNGNREIQFFGIQELRWYILNYHFPEFVPFFVPFALDGGGIFYAFDMRKEPVDDEYPIIATEAGVLDYDDSPIIATQFKQVLDDVRPISDYIYKS